MSTITPTKPVSDAPIPAVPLTLEGASVLHQVMRVRRPEWRALSSAERSAIVQQAAGTLGEWEGIQGGWSAGFSLLGHKGDLMFVHFRRDFPGIHEAQMQISRL